MLPWRSGWLRKSSLSTRPLLDIQKTPSKPSTGTSAATAAGSAPIGVRIRFTTSPPSEQNSATNPAVPAQVKGKSSLIVTALRQPSSRYA
jgi:hypothetical protein